ncbi:MAG: CFI-box-CTERM domain-containing protein, partial [Planctomycetota bacterium]
VFTYTTPGDYSARLSITYLDGDTRFRNTVITISASNNTPAISSILLSPQPPGTAPFAISLTANANPISGQIYAYLWDFDSNSTIDFVSTVSRVSHTYTKADDYYATVYVQNTLGLTAKFTTTRIRVTTSTLPPTAVIDLPVTDISITAGDNVLFSGQGLPSAGGVISKYEWDFDSDDNFDSVDTSLTKTYHTYLFPGTFSAKLRVTEISGSAPVGVSAETTRTIVVKPSLTPRAIITQAGIYKPNKDTLREDIDGYNVTIKIVPINYHRINRIDLRYRNAGFSIPDTFVAPIPPDEDPPGIISDCWKTTRFSISTTYVSDIKHEVFMTTLNSRWLTTDYWYEIIALVNYNPADNSYEDWNASQTQTRIFLKNVYTISPEIQEENVTKTIRTVLKRQNNSTTKNDTIVFIPAEGINVVANTLTIDTPASVVTPADGLTFINVFRDIKTDCAIQKLAFIKIGYPDDNNDSIVDETTISQTTLLIYRYDSVNSKWIPLLNQTVDRYNKTVGGWTTEWGTFGITGRLPEEEPTDTGSSGLGVPKEWAFCFIATAAYGSPMAEEVKTLSIFRDKYLITNSLGRRLVKIYYIASPPLAKFIAKKPFLRYITRQVLKPVAYMVKTLE